MEKIEKILRSHPFVTPRFLQNAHLQSLLPKYMQAFKTKLPEVEKKFIELPDGSKLVANCWWQKEKENMKRLLWLEELKATKDKKPLVL